MPHVGVHLSQNKYSGSSIRFFFLFWTSLRSLPTFKDRSSQKTFIVFTSTVCYNIAAVGLCLIGWMHPLMAAILMPSSSLATLGIAYLNLGRINSGPSYTVRE